MEGQRRAPLQLCAVPLSCCGYVAPANYVFFNRMQFLVKRNVAFVKDMSSLLVQDVMTTESTASDSDCKKLLNFVILVARALIFDGAGDMMTALIAKEKHVCVTTVLEGNTVVQSVRSGV